MPNNSDALFVLLRGKQLATEDDEDKFYLQECMEVNFQLETLWIQTINIFSGIQDFVAIYSQSRTILPNGRNGFSL